MFTATRSTRGETLPYGLGWFVREYLGLHVVWHYGLVSGYSSLFVRVPSRDLTLIVLADSSALSDEPRLLDGDLERSPAALAFLADVALASAASHGSITPASAIAPIRGEEAPSVPPADAGARELARDAVMAQASVEFYRGHLDESARLVELCTTQYADLGLPRETETFFLLAHLRRPELQVASMQMGKELLEIHPALAPALYYDGLAEAQAGDEAAAREVWKRACNQWPETAHWTVGESCFEAGQSYMGHDARLARLYLTRAILAGNDDTKAAARQSLEKLPPEKN